MFFEKGNDFLFFIMFSNDTMNFFIEFLQFVVLLNCLILLRFVDHVKKQDGSKYTSP